MESQTAEEKVRIRRKVGVEPVTSLSYIAVNDNHTSQWQPDPDESEFEVAADVAAAALESGGFERISENTANSAIDTDSAET